MSDNYHNSTVMNDEASTSQQCQLPLTRVTEEVSEVTEENDIKISIHTRQEQAPLCRVHWRFPLFMRAHPFIAHMDTSFFTMPRTPTKEMLSTSAANHDRGCACLQHGRSDETKSRGANCRARTAGLSARQPGRSLRLKIIGYEI